ncbi:MULTISPECIES: hypothetical protein [Bacillus cereus group]|nr:MULTISPECIES: hypothetical protein [Bacillus cereus group]
MDGFTLYWKVLHDFLNYVGKFAPLIILVIALSGFATISNKNNEKDK